MKKNFTAENLRVGYCLGILLLAVCSAIYFFERPSAAQRDDVEKTKITEEAEGLADFREATGSRVKPLIVELREAPGAVIQFQKGLANPDAFEAISAYALRLVNNQDAFRRSLPERGVQNLLRATKVRQIDGSVRLIEYRFTYLLNGFVAYIPVEQIEQLKAQPEVKNVYEIEESRFMLDNSIDYSLGTQFNPFDRRLMTYGANQELTPVGSPGHAETPRNTAIDGYEGQNINLAVIDSGVDWRHPMFGGIG